MTATEHVKYYFYPFFEEIDTKIYRFEQAGQDQTFRKRTICSLRAETSFKFLPQGLA